MNGHTHTTLKAVNDEATCMYTLHTKSTTIANLVHQTHGNLFTTVKETSTLKTSSVHLKIYGRGYKTALEAPGNSCEKNQEIGIQFPVCTDL